MSRFTHLQAVLFDLDGTLVDSAPDLGHAADLLRLKRGLPSLPYEQYRPMAGAGARGMIGVAFGYGLDHPEFEALRQEFFANYEACLTERTRAFDGIAELIGALQADGKRWGVVTNKSERFALPLTAALPLFERFSDHRTLEVARRHRDVIARFGRFPHRNTLLGRVSSAEELAFLQTPGSRF